ncbi:MAG: zinc-ribbon domain-containing protein [Lachnospiraceae bacterium]|nr:zinc-ribbon domain-containing protein [Lachnospiraceae bacterium]
MFCNQCGTQVNDDQAFCPNCGAPMGAEQTNTAPQMNSMPNSTPYQQPAMGGMPGGNTNNTIALVLGIVSIVLGVLGGLLFGIFGAMFGLIAGVVGLVLSIGVRKATNNAQGTPAFICALIGLIFSVIFAAGCSICGCSQKAAGLGDYTCYGCVGGNCKAQSDLKNAYRDLNNIFNDWY